MSGSRRACCKCGAPAPFDKCCPGGDVVGYLIVEHVVGSFYRLITPISIGWTLADTIAGSPTVSFDVPETSFENAVGSVVLCDPIPIADGPFAGKYRASKWNWTRGVHPDLPIDGTASVTYAGGTGPGGPYPPATYPGRFLTVAIDAAGVTADIRFFNALTDPPSSAIAATIASAAYLPLSGKARGVIGTSGRSYFGDAAYLNPLCVPPSAASSPIAFSGSRVAAAGSITADATLVANGTPILCPGVGSFDPFDCNDPLEPPEPDPECCDPPSASGWVFAEETTHAHGVYVNIKRYAGAALREEWNVDIRDNDEGPPQSSNCAGSGSGETVVGSSPEFIARKWTYSDSDPPVPTNIRVVYSASLGEDSAHPSGAQSILTVHDGPNAGSPVLFRLTHNSDGTITRTGTPITLSGLTITQGEIQATPAGGVPFWTNLFAQIQSIGGLLPGAGSNWGVDVGHGVLAFGHSQCPPSMLLTATSENPAATDAIERHMSPATKCKGCGDR
jgi:hypothetical protein